MQKHMDKKHPQEVVSEDSTSLRNQEESYASNMDWIDELFVFTAPSPQSSRTENGRFKTQNLLGYSHLKDSEEEKQEAVATKVNDFGEHLSLS